MSGSSRWNVFEKKGYNYLSRCSVFLSFTGVRFHLTENSHRFSLSNESALGFIYSFQISLRPRFYGEKLSPEKRVTLPPELPWASQIFLHFLTKLTNHLHVRRKVDSARRVTSLAGSPSFDGRVPLRAELTFLRINILARPAGSTRSRRDGRSMRGQLLIRAKGSNSFSYKRSLKLTWQGK